MGCSTGRLPRDDMFRYRPRVWFRVLGRLEIRRPDGSPLRISGPARRQLLSAVLSRAGTAVSAANLIDDLWGTAPPRSTANTLRSYIVRLRNDLGHGRDASVLVTEGDGYRLDVDLLELAASSRSSPRCPIGDSAGEYIPGHPYQPLCPAH